jgi:hypothetical protein
VESDDVSRTVTPLRGTSELAAIHEPTHSVVKKKTVQENLEEYN